jgi:nitroreductase
MTDDLFAALVEAAARAPSADNMQAWEFGRRADAIEAFLEPRRVLPTDVGAMFGWVGLGAAVENVVITAARRGFTARVEYGDVARTGAPPALLQLSRGGADDPLAYWIPERVTDRGPYAPEPLDPPRLARLDAAARGLDVGVHWITAREGLAAMAAMDARSTYIRLEHGPLRDEVFSVLRFTRQEVESTRYGLDFEALGVPSALVLLARWLRHSSINEAASRLGFGRAVARVLASRLRAAGALCLVTARRDGPSGYVEAGRAMERIWLTAASMGLAVQPHGVLPQYLTKLEAEPEAFLPRHAATLRGHREPFYALFPEARGERLAIILRVGNPVGPPPRRSVRLPRERLLRAQVWSASSGSCPTGSPERGRRLGLTA